MGLGKYSNGIRSRRILLIYFLALCLTLANNNSAFSIDKVSPKCKAVTKQVLEIDSRSVKYHSKYLKQLKATQANYSTAANIKLTRSLLRVIQSDKSAYIVLLENKQCFNSSNIKNLEWTLWRASEQADILLSWIRAEIGIPIKNYYANFEPIMEYVKFRQVGFYCPKLGKQTKTLVCKEFPEGLYWRPLNPDEETEIKGEPTEISDFIDGKVSLYGAKVMTQKLFEDLTAETNASIPKSLEFVKKVAYPGLYDFESPEMIERCNKYFTDITLVPGTYSFTYTPDLDGLRPDPDWVIKEDTYGAKILNTKFEGQVFAVTVTIDVTENGIRVGDPITKLRHVAVLNGLMYRFIGC